MHPLLHQLSALLLACNYFAFQVELFEEEYEANHRTMSEETSFAAPSLNWESFDKNNAPRAFVVHVTFHVDLLLRFSPPQLPPLQVSENRNPVRDKSPPHLHSEFV
jgi:hypothetical protein